MPKAAAAIPVTSLSGNLLTVTIGTQTDTYTFTPRTATIGGQSVTMNEFTLVRNGATLVNYLNQIEPANFR